MPSFDVHKDKYAQNKKFLNDIYSLESSKNWQVTVIFYCAVHYLEALLSNCFDDMKNNGIYKINFTGHSHTHEERNKMLDMTNEFEYGSDCAIAYEKLESQSRKARYDHFKPSDRILERAHKWLELIENVEKLTVKC